MEFLSYTHFYVNQTLTHGEVIAVMWIIYQIFLLINYIMQILLILNILNLRI